MRLIPKDDQYYAAQNERSGLSFDNNEIGKYFDRLQVQVGKDFCFLDIGCRGHASAVSFMHNAGAQSYGFDIGEDAKKSWDSQRLPFRENLKTHDAHHPFGYEFSFDLISISHALEHCHKPSTVIENIREALKEGGKVWSIVPIEEEGTGGPPHYCLFNSHEEHLQIYKSAGFKIMWAERVGDNSLLVAQKTRNQVKESR